MFDTAHLITHSCEFNATSPSAYNKYKATLASVPIYYGIMAHSITVANIHARDPQLQNQSMFEYSIKLK